MFAMLRVAANRPVHRGQRGLRSVALAAIVLFAMTASAEPQRYRVDGHGSKVDFTVRYLGLFSPGGGFNDVAGSVAFDSGDWRTLTVAIRIPVNTLTARPAFWRSELLGPQFFDAPAHPAIVFTSTRVERTGAASAAVHGNLTLRATTLPVVLATHIAPDAAGIEIDAEAKVSRSAFGLTGTLLLAGDEVTVSMHLRVVPAAAAPDATAAAHAAAARGGR